MPAFINIQPMVIAGTFLGIGLGGFVDGILFHQILQIHSMLSATTPRTSIANMEINMFWDGLFHAMTWTMTVSGLWLLFNVGRQKDVPWSGKILVGSMALGWGLFNFIEGIIDHHILNLHHVMEVHGQSVFDYGFLAFGVVLIVGGLYTIRSAAQGELSSARGE